MIQNLKSRYVKDEEGKWWYLLTKKRRTSAVIRKCLACGEEFLTIPSRVNRGGKQGMFCSRSCGTKALGGHRNKTGKMSHLWKGGRVVVRGGYINVFAPDHPYAVGGKYVREHRLVMEKKIGRYLERWEVVHHKNGIKNDNRIKNLELWTHSHPAGSRLGEVAKHCPTCSCRS